MHDWNNVGKRERKEIRKKVAADLLESMRVCKSRQECMHSAVKLAMMKFKYSSECPRNCPTALELLAMQVLTSNKAEDFEFILKFFPELQTADEAEKQYAVQMSGYTKKENGGGKKGA